MKTYNPVNPSEDHDLTAVRTLQTLSVSVAKHNLS